MVILFIIVSLALGFTDAAVAADPRRHYEYVEGDRMCACSQQSYRVMMQRQLVAVVVSRSSDARSSIFYGQFDMLVVYYLFLYL
jgi:hypothetical protein